ncbi:MAG TPA: hypothetical protein VK154_18325 [Chitinophagales bacterium]|nr:hypothetical protein [Chitinophagales bacterium]
MSSPTLSYDSFGRPIADNKQVSISDYLLINNEDTSDGPVPRLSQNPVGLMLRAIGGPRLIANKTARLAVTLFNTVYLPVQHKRLQRLMDIGFIEKIPSQKQLWFGAIDMLRYFISPGAASYYKTKGINFTFHQVLRFLNDPSGIADPIGIRVPRDTIICHLLEVVHANPVYDLQLLDQFADGLDEMEKQTAQMLDGTHPRYKSITAITEDATYHARLQQYLKHYRQNPTARQMLRASGMARNNPYFLLAECMFGTLPSAFRYFNRLPDTWGALIKHYRQNPQINPALCDEWIVQQVWRDKE